MSTLTYIVGWPLFTALVLCFYPAQLRVVIRGVALLATFDFGAAVRLKCFCCFNCACRCTGFRFEQKSAWVNLRSGIGYHVGVDGINVGLILMGAIVAFRRGLRFLVT